MKKENRKEVDFILPKSQEFITNPEISAFRKYKRVAVGADKGVLSLLNYEVLTSLVGPMPGALGYFLRQKCYPSLFRKMGPKVTIGRNVTLRHPGGITLGRNVAIDDNVLLEARDGEMIIGDNTIVSRNSIITTRGGSISIGANCSIGTDVKIATLSNLVLEDYVLVAAYCYIGGGNHRHDRLDMPVLSQGMEHQKGVSVGHGVWLGAGSIVLDGVSIGPDAIIGAAALVNKDIPGLAVAVGQPAEVIRYRDGR